MYQYQLSPQDCHIGILPLYHTAGLCFAMAVMHAGGKTIMVDRFDAETALQLIARERGSLFFSFAPVLRRLIDRYHESPGDLSSIRNVMGMDDPDTIRAFLRIAPQATYWTGYGQTETMIVSACSFQERPGSAGRPCVLANVVLRDEGDSDVPEGLVGEICVRSPMVFGGYWRRADDSSHVSRNGWHHTGDLGRFDRDGYHWYMCR
jgi:long-chain acyl-CoA synthetase